MLRMAPFSFLVQTFRIRQALDNLALLCLLRES